MLWLTFLPLTLYQVMGWAAIIAEAVIAFLFLGIDNIGMSWYLSAPLAR